MKNAVDSGKERKSLMLPMRIFCLVLAVVIWLFVVNITSDNYEKTFDVDVRIEGADVLSEKSGMSVYDQTESRVSVTVSGKRSDIQELDESRFRAFIDVASLEQFGRTSVPVKVSAPEGTKIQKISPESVDIYTDKIESVEFPLTVDLVSYSISTSYEIGAIRPEKSAVTVSGPKSMLERIRTAVAFVDLGSTWLTGGFDNVAPISLYASDGTKMTSEFLLLSESSVNVHVDVLRYSSLPLSYAFEPGFDSSRIASVTVTPAMLFVKGEESLIAETQKLQILTIGAGTPTETEIPISDVRLPSGLEVRGSTDKITVRIEYKPVETQPPETQPHETVPPETEPQTEPIGSGAVAPEESGGAVDISVPEAVRTP